MNDCFRCPVEKQCHYPFKVCDCVGQRKFWTVNQRQSYDADQAEKRGAPDHRITNRALIK